MALKTFKPYTKSTRGTILVDRTGLWKGKPFKSLVSPKNAMKGRNNNGHITNINRSGGHKKMYRHVDFYRKKFDMEATVERIEYDPNRSCYIMLVKFEDGSHAYYLAPQKIKAGDKIENGSKKEIKVGNCMPLQDIPVGINIHNVEIQPGAGGTGNLQGGNSSNAETENRQAFLTFGDKSWGSVKVGKDLGIFGSTAILNDMTLLGVGGGAGGGGGDVGGLGGASTSVDSTITLVPLTATMRTWVPSVSGRPFCDVAPHTSPWAVTRPRRSVSSGSMAVVTMPPAPKVLSSVPSRLNRARAITAPVIVDVLPTATIRSDESTTISPIKS